MKNQHLPTASVRSRAVLSLLARVVLGAMFIYLGWSKAADPVGFLKLLRQYQLVDNYLLLNFIAVVLPWFEMFCGILIIGGVAVRGTALILLLMLTGFTGLIIQRALVIHDASHIPFCSVHFDCGCGTGEVFACWKTFENLSLGGLAVAVLIRGSLPARPNARKTR